MSDETQEAERPDAPAPGDDPAPDGTLHRDERGAISVLFVFGMLAFVLLLGLLFNTARQTSRKIEMQGAADASAIAGGAYVARGMNLVVFNNCGMADVLAVMTTTHAYLMAINYTNVITKAICAGLKSNPFTAGFGAAWETAWEIYYNIAHPLADQVDEFLSGSNGVGWDIMRTIDTLNQVLRPAIGPAAAVHATAFAVLNGAEKQYLLPHKTDLDPKIPSPPIDRGPQQAIAVRAESCPAPALSDILRITMAGATLSAPIMLATYEAMLAWNWSNLQSGGGGSGLDQDEMVEQGLEQTLQNVHDNPQRAVDYLYNDLALFGTRTAIFMNNHPDLEYQFGSPPGNFDSTGFAAYLLNNPDAAEMYVRETRSDEIKADIKAGFPGAGNSVGGGTGSDWEPLGWPDDPPRPMVLDVDDDDSVVVDTPAEVNKRLRYLSVAWAEMRPSPIGPDRFSPQTQFGWLTFAQVRVYNPTKADMFSQDWRVQLTNAWIFEEKFDDLRTEYTNVVGMVFPMWGGIADDYYEFVITH